MNLKSAKDIPLALLVEHLGGRYSHDGRKGETWWFSPFRPDERTASFIIHEALNTWHDFARTEKKDAHGGLLDLWTDYHNQARGDKIARKEAWKTIIGLFGNQGNPSPKTGIVKKHRTEKVDSENIARYTLIKEPDNIWLKPLKQELARRRLSMSIVEPFLKQAFIKDNKLQKKFNAFAFRNDAGGWEVSTNNTETGYSFKSCIGKKAPTSYFTENAETVLVFESRWDFLTWLEMSKGKNQEKSFVVANGAGMSQAVAEVLMEKKGLIRQVLVYQHNDIPKETDTGLPAGERFTLDLIDALQETDIASGTMNDLYKEYKDLNEWWMLCSAARHFGMQP